MHSLNTARDSVDTAHCVLGKDRVPMPTVYVCWHLHMHYSHAYICIHVYCTYVHVYDKSMTCISWAGSHIKKLHNKNLQPRITPERKRTSSIPPACRCIVKTLVPHRIYSQSPPRGHWLVTSCALSSDQLYHMLVWQTGHSDTLFEHTLLSLVYPLIQHAMNMYCRLGHDPCPRIGSHMFSRTP